MWTVWIVDFIDMNTYSYKTQNFRTFLKENYAITLDSITYLSEKC